MGNISQIQQLKAKNNQFKIHIAIDFGTDGCALAFAYNGKVSVYNKWNAKRRQRAVKAKTQVLLNDKDEIVAFGNKAKMIYSNLTGKERENWKFFERFKMSLHDSYDHSKLYKNDKQIQEMEEEKQNYVEKHQRKNSMLDWWSSKKKHHINLLTSINGAQSPADTVFVAAFKYLQEIAKEYIPKVIKGDDIQIKDDEIQWIITVPAIWIEKAKNRMKQWAIDAGLVDKNNEDQCKIVYEPDCAALAIYHDIKNNEPAEMKNDEDYQKQKYILIDAGGGTVDLACHEVVNGKFVEETYYPTGDEWGGCIIDDKYKLLLETIFSPEWMEEFKSKLPNVYIEVIDNFIDAKITFYENNESTHSTQFPYEFIQFLHEKCKEKGCSIEEHVNEYCKKKDIDDFRKIFQKKKRMMPKQAQPQALDDEDQDEQKNEDINNALQEDANNELEEDKTQNKDIVNDSKPIISNKPIEDTNIENKAEEIIIPTIPKNDKSGFDLTQFMDPSMLESSDDETQKETIDDTKINNESQPVIPKSVHFLSMDDEHLVMNVRIWKFMFDSVINKTINHVNMLLDDDSVKNGCKYLYLVGGFSCSKYYQHRMKTEFGKDSKHKLLVIIPENPTLCIVRGAAYFAIKKNFIMARRSKFSYGVLMTFNIKQAKEIGISDQYIRKHKTDSGQIQNCFNMILRKNERIAMNETRKKRAKQIGKTTCLEILQSAKEDAKLSYDGIQIAKLLVEHGDYGDEEAEIIVIEFHFYDTEMKVYAYAENRPNEKYRVEINYE